MQSFIVIFLLLTVVDLIISQEWDYGEFGPDVWSDTYPLCASFYQSPINIRTACTTYRSFSSFQFSSPSDLIQNFTLLNNGHTIQGLYTNTNASVLTLTGGGLNGTFELVNFHLHWGENYKSGSEHQVNGIKYAGEIHFVYRNPETQRTAVLAMFMNSTQDTNINEKDETLTMEEWKQYFTVAGTLQDINDSIVYSLNLAVLMGMDLNNFWRYDGSLTTPPCTEGIIWTIFKTPIMFTESELGSFRKNIFFEDYRGPQPLHNRAVHRSFYNELSSSISDYDCCSKDLSNSANRLFDHDSFSLLFIQRTKVILFPMILFCLV